MRTDRLTDIFRSGGCRGRTGRRTGRVVAWACMPDSKRLNKKYPPTPTAAASNTQSIHAKLPVLRGWGGWGCEDIDSEGGWDTETLSEL